MVMTESESIVGIREQVKKHAEEVIQRLIDPRGALLVGIGGVSGVGKTFLASLIANDRRIIANFPGGAFYLELGKQPNLSSLQASLWTGHENSIFVLVDENCQ